MSINLGNSFFVIRWILPIFAMSPRSFGNQLLPLLDGSLLARGETAKPFVAVKEADKTFGEVVFFNLYMETLTPDAFKYWSEVSLLLPKAGVFLIPLRVLFGGM